LTAGGGRVYAAIPIIADRLDLANTTLDPGVALTEIRSP
jgi:hypothetical protein